jgi:GntR family transcriptional regulator
VEEPSRDVAQALKLPPGERIYSLKRLRFVNGLPVAIVNSHLPERIFPGIDKQDLEKQSLYDVFERVYGRKLHWAEEVISAVTAEEEVARVLETEPGRPLLSIKETTYDVQRAPVEFSISLLRGDRYTASVISLRKK